jgi:hypothetical protein
MIKTNRRIPPARAAPIRKRISVTGKEVFMDFILPNSIQVEEFILAFHFNVNHGFNKMQFPSHRFGNYDY